MEIAMKNNNPDSHPQFFNYAHYTFICQRNKILGYGTNMAGPAKYGYKPYMKIHSEYVAYNKYKYLLKKEEPFEIVNVRLSRLNSLKISMPCNCCISYLKLTGCRRVYFSTPAGFSSLIF